MDSGISWQIWILATANPQNRYIYKGSSSQRQSMSHVSSLPKDPGCFAVIRNLPQKSPSKRKPCNQAVLDQCSQVGAHLNTHLAARPALPILLLDLDHWLGTRSTGYDFGGLEEPQLFDSLPAVARIEPTVTILQRLAKSWQLQLVSALKDEMQTVAQKYLDARFSGLLCAIHFTTDKLIKCDQIGASALLCDTWATAVAAESAGFKKPVQILLLGDPYDWTQRMLRASPTPTCTIVADWEQAFGHLLQQADALQSEQLPEQPSSEQPPEPTPKSAGMVPKPKGIEG